MALPVAHPTRQARHRRSIELQVYARDDGLWEVDARLIDSKSRDIQLGGKPLPAGAAIHDMLLRLVVNRNFDILEAGALTLAMPYADQCDQHGDAYGRLVGLNLMRGFRQAVKERLGGVQGCTHLTELALLLPTAVVQGFAGEVLNASGQDGARPFQIDRCHALRSDGEVVRLHYPQWHRSGPAHNARPAPAAAPQPAPIDDAGARSSPSSPRARP